MKISFVVQRVVDPPDAGTPIRNYNLIKRVAADHEVSVFGFSDRDKWPVGLVAAESQMRLLDAPAARGRRQRIKNLLFSPLPDMAHRSYSPQLLQLLRSELAPLSPAVVQIQALDMAYTIPVIRQVVPQARIVLDQHNAEYVLQARARRVDLEAPRRWPLALYSLVQSAKLRSYERHACQMADVVLTVSQEDRSALQALGITTPIAVIPNGANMPSHEAIMPAAELAETKGYHFVFPGKMDFRPNVDAAVWFATKVHPHLRESLPDAHFWIVGRDPSPDVQRLRHLPQVHVTGEVPGVEPYIVGAIAVVVPLRMGSGTKLKILEAAALRKPIVTTPVGAEGYEEAVAGRDMLVASTAEEIAAACHRIAMNPSLALQLGEGAFQHIARPLDWDVIYERLKDVYELAASSQA